MNVFVDESGTFTVAGCENSWCTIAAYVSPEGERRHIEKLVLGLRPVGSPSLFEVKLNELTEDRFFLFLEQLGKLRGVLFGVAADMGLSGSDVDISTHKAKLVERIADNESKMIYTEGRAMVVDLKNRVAAMPNQLYAQLRFQISLFHEVVQLSTLYYVQRTPQTLSSFRWRVDAKDITVTAYERTFRHLLPILLERMSASDPIGFLEGADYSAMKRFEFETPEVTLRLSNELGRKVDGINIGKVVGDDFQFVNSKTNFGVQVADLLASAVRRLLRGEFSDNGKAAKLIGGLTIKGEKKRGHPFRLQSLTEHERIVDAEIQRRVLMLQAHARNMMN